MSRRTEYVRKCPDTIRNYLDTAKDSQFYVLQETGPTAFIISENEAKKYKVGIGYTNYCNCSKFSMEENTCVHIAWLMLRVYHVPITSDVLYQSSLVEREINDILSMRKQHKPKIITTPELNAVNDGKRGPPYKVPPRDIDEEDLCRKTFGTVENITKELEAPKKTERRQFIHLGVQCQGCENTRVTGRLHRCLMCKDHYLCDDCFKSGSHSEHSFEFRSRPTSKWLPSVRAVEPILPDSVIREFEGRELTDEDYETLLTLGSGPQQQGTVPLQIINSFLVAKYRNHSDRIKFRLDTHGKCKVCTERISWGDLVRQIPCGHDRWLLHQRSTCPTCGLAAYTNIHSDGVEEEQPLVDAAKYKACSPISNSIARKKRRAIQNKKNGIHLSLSDSMSDLLITGSELFGKPTNTNLDPSRINLRKPKLAKLPPISRSLPNLMDSQEHSQRDMFWSNPAFSSQLNINTKKQSSHVGCSSLGLPPQVPKFRKQQKPNAVDLVICASKQHLDPRTNTSL
ncbi:E3 ubiquitin-protein ligase Zswim2 [Globomyces sp. JEL0801]|nr:E3 ubiquitin-protein ligase Zswim2 [Globomyces sp. JEL0801]